MRRRVLRILAALVGLSAVAVVAAVLWGRAELLASLPVLDGEHRLPGLSAPAHVTRDALGIPTVRAATRVDVARATGFLHAQDRFFQMDLARRRAAGELAALVGVRALPLDREIRVHRFRAVARESVTLMDATNRAILDAYAAGVNTGLQRLGASPFEYLVLGQSPAPWRPEDTLLVVLSMFITLQDSEGSYESTLGTMEDLLPRAVAEFLAPRGSEWDTPIVGAPFPMPPVPGREVYDLRRRRAGKPARALRELSSRASDGFDPQAPNWAALLGGSPSDAGGGDAIGSNNFAVSGRLTSDGRAILANDMHLTVRVPNTWYRASLEWPDPSSGELHRVIGVTLPGVPAVVAGSNTHIAWGFTNTYADWSDIVLLELDPARPDWYRTPDGWRQIERHEEVIAVAGASDEQAIVRTTIWGPIIGADHRGRQRAFRWAAHDPRRLAVSIVPLELARTIDEAFDEANGLGVPGQNLVVASADGRIGWSVYGAIPNRVGLDGRVPVSWADGTRGWNGWIERTEYPRLTDPIDGRIWTANARVVDGEMLARLGDGSYEIGSRARIIRDRLFARERFDAGDLLRIQLDTSATFLARWRRLLVDALTADAVRNEAQRASLRGIVQGGWTDQAAPESAAYRLTRTFRDAVFDRVTAFVLAECYEADPNFDYTTIRRREAAIWRLVSEQPQHLLDSRYDSWNELLLEAVDATIEDATSKYGDDLRARTWSEYNVTAFRHPLSAAIPFSGRWLDMPAAVVPGDLFTPRVHWGTVAASERMVVSPGHEDEGILHMPTGQSGHPMSPFYANSHAAWIDGDPAPFLPGPAQHTLTLSP